MPLPPCAPVEYKSSCVPSDAFFSIMTIPTKRKHRTAATDTHAMMSVVRLDRAAASSRAVCSAAATLGSTVVMFTVVVVSVVMNGWPS